MQRPKLRVDGEKKEKVAKLLKRAGVESGRWSKGLNARACAARVEIPSRLVGGTHHVPSSSTFSLAGRAAWTGDRPWETETDDDGEDAAKLRQFQGDVARERVVVYSE